jgi:class 3 adenylate cyclase
VQPLKTGSSSSRSTRSTWSTPRASDLSPLGRHLTRLDVPKTRYAINPSGARIAYQVVGSRGPDIVLATNHVSCIDLMWEDPRIERFLLRLASCGRLIIFDKRGTGGSDRLAAHDGTYVVSLLEQATEDLLSVLDAASSTTATVIGTDHGGWSAILFTATHPQRVTRLVLQDATAKLLQSDDHPWGINRAEDKMVLDAITNHWGTGISLDGAAPSIASEPETRRWFGRYERLSIPPADMRAHWEHAGEVDVRAALPLVRRDTLVISHPDTWMTRGQGKYLAEHLPAASHVELDGPDTWFFVDERIADAIVAFVGSAARPSGSDGRVLATMLCTDLVSSTAKLADIGDRRWRDVLDIHDRVSARVIEEHRGHLVKRTGDGLLATFDGPARAVRCASNLGIELQKLGLGMRAGVHAGEIELRDDDIGGIAVHLTARVMSEASPGEILVTRTVKDLTAGSGLDFAEHGSHYLKGIPEPCDLYVLRTDERVATIRASKPGGHHVTRAS